MSNNNLIRKETLMNYLNIMQTDLVQQYKDDPANYNIAVGFQACIDYINLLYDTGVIIVKTKEQ